MAFVGYADGHAGNCYRMYNLVTSRVCETRDIIWCGQMYFTSETVLKKLDEGKEILAPAKQTLYRSGMGKGMHMMQYSRPDTYNAARNLARHMTCATQVHYDAVLRMMKYVDDTSDRGLVLNPTRKWNGSKVHKFIISGQSDSDYA